MRYWSYLTAKLAGAAAIVYALMVALVKYFPRPAPSRYGPESLFLHDMPFTFAVFGIWLTGAGLFYIAVWDQRRRCRTCLRRLVMPIATGSWGHMLTFGRPRTEWICPYGHGTLRISNLQITGSELPDWKPNCDDIWRELESYDHSSK
jgi:hypothetical protein